MSVIEGELIKEEIPQQTTAIQVRREADQLPPPVTAAQAKVEAIASLTQQAYAKAATLQLTPDEIKALQADFPDDAFQPGAAGKENLIYIEHAHLRDRLNQVLGLGQWAIIPRSRWAEPFMTKGSRDKPPTPGSRVYVEAMLLIRGCFVGEAIGAMEYYPENASQNYGDAVEGSKTAAFRRCAKELGVGLQAWKRTGVRVGGPGSAVNQQEGRQHSKSRPWHPLRHHRLSARFKKLFSPIAAPGTE